MSEHRRDERHGGDEETERSSARSLAEWVSLGVSALLILGLAAFLVYEIFRGNDPYNLAETAVLIDEVRQVEQLYILPVAVGNRGERTLRDLQVELTYTPPGSGQPEKAEMRIDYLGEGSKQTVYFYLNHDPRQMPVNVRPLYYRLD